MCKSFCVYKILCVKASLCQSFCDSLKNNLCPKASVCMGVYMSERLWVNASVWKGICVEKLLCVEASAASV